MDWLRSFLSNRPHYVETTQQRSSLSDIKIGLPQGSEQGPCLLILNVNNWNKYLSMLKSIHFVDDTTLYLDTNTSSDPTSFINTTLVQVQTWINANKLSLKK